MVSMSKNVENSKICRGSQAGDLPNKLETSNLNNIWQIIRADSEQLVHRFFNCLRL